LTDCKRDRSYEKIDCCRGRREFKRFSHVSLLSSFQAPQKVVKDGVATTVSMPRGLGAGAAHQNNGKLLLNSITPFSIR
jgi:hypothetical protein